MNTTNDSDLGGDNPFSSEIRNEFGGAPTPSQVYRHSERGSRLKVYAALGCVIALGSAGFYYYTTHREEPVGDFVVPEEGSPSEAAPEVAPEVGLRQDMPPSGEGSDTTLLGDSHGELEGGEAAAKRVPVSKPLDGIGDGSSPLARSFARPVSHASDARKEAVRLPQGVRAVTLVSPAHGAVMPYDESREHPLFKWQGGLGKGAKMVLSKDPSLKPVEFQAKVKGFQWEGPRLAQGMWYWALEDSALGDGTRDSAAGLLSEVFALKVSPPQPRNLILVEPKAGQTLAGEGGMVVWLGDSKVSYYKVEFSHGAWAKLDYRFATSGTQLAVKGVDPGDYQVRVGCFSEVSGKWEYTAAVAVHVP